ncbi:hypothetical protein LG291_24835 [Cytobacillus firmus]|uniref:hypothetical protein n=1 Tax=Cytobacillus firmus TaxID=1399 RepID=UPI00384C5721
MQNLSLKIKEMLDKYFSEIMENYNQTALLLNSCKKAATYYHSKSSKTAIDTTSDLPSDFKLNTDISTIFIKKELINQYENKLSVKLAKDYLITTVATLDGLMEDLYEVILIEQEPDKSEDEIKGMISWRDPGLLFDLQNRLPTLKTHTNPKGYKLEDFLHTYEHLRQIRHALIHSKGRLNKRHIKKMLSLEDKMNEKQRESVQQLYKDKQVVLSPQITFLLRHWCLTYFGFLTVALKESIEIK